MNVYSSILIDFAIYHGITILFGSFRLLLDATLAEGSCITGVHGRAKRACCAVHFRVCVSEFPWPAWSSRFV